MGKNKGSKGAELGKKLLKEFVKDTLGGRKISQPQYSLTELTILHIEQNYNAWSNYYSLYNEYIVRYNDFVSSFVALERTYFHILLLAACNYVLNTKAFKHEWWDDDWGFQLFSSLLSDTRTDTLKLFSEAIGELKRTLANIEYIRLYSLAFIGDESLSVPAEKCSCVIDIHKRLKTIVQLCSPDIYPESLPVIPKKNSENILKAFKNIDLTKKLAPGLLSTYTTDLLWKED